MFACCRVHTVEGNTNKRLTTYLEELQAWWEHAAKKDEAKTYAQKVPLLVRVTSLVRCWPVELTTSNWAEERPKLLKQHYIEDKTQSATGGWIAALEQLVKTGGVERPDSIEAWGTDPCRRAMVDLCKFHIGIGPKTAQDLYEKHGITSLKDLIDHPLTPGMKQDTRFLLDFLPLPGTPSAVPISFEEQRGILDLVQRAGATCTVAGPLEMTLVGSARRGLEGGHDVDIAAKVASSAEKFWSPSRYGFKDPEGLAARISDELRQKLAETQVFGESFDVGRRSGRTTSDAPKVAVFHLLVRSPTVQDAVRPLDLIFCPPEIFAHTILSWSGSTAFQRSLHHFATHAHMADWAHVPDRKPIVGRRGYNLNANGNRIGNVVLGRTLDLAKNEHWAWSQNGVTIKIGSSRSVAAVVPETVYEELNDHFETEKDIFDFFHLEYRAPHERCA